jgi:hypothetical protein
MSTSAYTRIPVIILAALALAACPFKKDKKHDEDHGPSIYYVSASAGLDTNPGTQSSQFKTITHAMSVATRSGTTVRVAPGTYGSSETFPITVPAGVLLIGDETNKGGGSTPTSIVGGGLAPGATAGSVGVALLPGTGSTIAGFTVTNNNGSFADRRGLILRNSTVTLRNNTVTGATHKAGVYIDASTNHVITGNRIVDNGGTGTGSGLAFSKGGVGSKVENNVITGNGFGVEYDVAGGDLGGGSAGSAGGNVISCNTQNGLVSFAPTAIMITAASNLWDHALPTRGSGAGDDIYDSSGLATINATPAAQASNPCAGVTLYVSVSAGLDTNPGTQSSPFKTITHAMSVATSGATVQVAPGIYDASSLSTPEVFPITVPAGVLLIGNEGNKGGGTSIVGGGQVPTFPAGTSAAVQPGTGSTIAGFTITNDNPALSGRYGVFLSNSTVTLRNNTVTGATHVIGVYVADDGGSPPTPSTNHVITGNRIVDNAPSSGEGLAFVSGGAGSKVENNVITGNGFGVDYEVAGGDLGGGSALSVGGNVISCNAFVDLFVGVPVTISAKNNLWDHLPPTPLTHACTFAGTGEDICDASGTATIDASNAALAPSPCL